MPYPAVVLGDLLRDSLGAPAPLGLTAYDGTGNPIPGEHINFFAVDSTVSVDSRRIRARPSARYGGRARRRQRGNLQTLAHRIFVTVQPVAATKGSGATEIDFVVLNTDSTNATNNHLS